MSKLAIHAFGDKLMCLLLSIKECSRQNGCSYLLIWDEPFLACLNGPSRSGLYGPQNGRLTVKQQTRVAPLGCYITANGLSMARLLNVARPFLARLVFSNEKTCGCLWVTDWIRVLSPSVKRINCLSINRIHQ